MSRKQIKRRTDSMARFAIVGFFILAIAGGVGFGVASADSSDDLANAGAFGFDEATHAATKTPASDRLLGEGEGPGASGDQSVLTDVATRDLDAGFSLIDQREAAAKEQAEKENAEAVQRVESTKAMQGVTAQPSAGDEDSGTATEYNLPAVDWTVGKEAFLEEWTRRIDAYLEGSNLAGYGAVFAEAAWDNGVDPRWSPAISNTESGKGSVCFLPYNAWGWGASAWPDWTTAIRAHVAGLAEGYGYCITTDAALKYCPPTYMHWYEVTLGQMALI